MCVIWKGDLICSLTTRTRLWTSLFYAVFKSDRNLQFATKQPQAGLYAKKSWLGVWVKVSLSVCVVVVLILSAKWRSSFGYFYVTDTWLRLEIRQLFYSC